jgi:alpha,alpha-trehalose phosphorylase
LITHRAFTCEPWGLRERDLDLAILAQTESLFALSNGHIGLRGNLDGGEPFVINGTYLNAFYEARPLPYAETAYGFPEAGQELVNITDGKIIRLLVDDEIFDVRYGELLEHERFLDFRAGVLERRVKWRSPAGKAVSISSTRIVSFAERSVAAVVYEVEPLDELTRLVVQSELVANEPVQAARIDDPRAATAPDSTLVPEDVWQGDRKVILVHSTRRSGLRVAAGMDHVIEAPDRSTVATESSPELGRVTVAAALQPGSRLRIVKFVAYAWSSVRSVPALRDQVDAALSEARLGGWEGLARRQRKYLDHFWDQADIVIDGDPEIQQAVRFGLFHVLQSAARAEERAIGAKGLTGPGYDGHTFWDSGTFAGQVLTYTHPGCVASALRWRHSTLPMARARAQQLGLKGAAFPWRTIHGEEASGYWPASTAAFHINADIADDVVRYIGATEDVDFEREYGVELLVETARLWASVGHFQQATFRIDGVTGPDEYSALADNNLYTNLMAQRNLRAAAAAVARHPDRAAELNVQPDEIADWEEAAAAMVVPFDPRLGVHEQSEGFTRHQVWDFEHTTPDMYPLLLHFPYFDLYRKQVLKQADLVLALHLRGDAFSPEEKLRNFNYYEPLTVRDSSLSACTQSVIAAEVGYLDLAYDYLGEAALIDLEDLEHNVRDGLHIAALAGAWIGVVAGFGGMRDYGSVLEFAPKLPPAVSSIAFTIVYRGRRLKVDIGRRSATYELLEGAPLTIRHYGQPVSLQPGSPARRSNPARPRRLPPRPAQPPGRAPLPRGQFRRGIVNPAKAPASRARSSPGGPSAATQHR